MGKVSGNRKELNPETVVTLWTDFKTKLTVKELCNVLELPWSTFYRWLQRTVDLRDEIEEKIKDVCLRHKLRYGYRRVTATLRKMGLCVWNSSNGSFLPISHNCPIPHVNIRPL